MVSININQTSLANAARDYSEAFSGTRRFLIRHRPKICPFDQILAFIEPDNKIFDIGCGSGFLLYAALVLRQISGGYGVDVDSPAIEAANQAFHHQVKSDTFHFTVASEPDKWPAEEFDAVTMIDLLHHVPPSRLDNFVRQAAAMVKPGGRLIVKDMAGDRWVYAMANRLHDLLLARQWINYIDMDKISISLQREGWVEESRQERIMWLYSHRLIILRRPEPSAARAQQ